MSKIMDDGALARHLSEALYQTEALLTTWRDSASTEDRKRAQILGYWIKTYTGMLRRERDFNPQSLPKLRHRQIVSVDFGFRVGSEIGGLHYAVVLDKQNRSRSNTVAVVPLGSLKPTFKASSFQIELPDGIYPALRQKVKQQVDDAKAMLLSVTTDQALLSLPEEERLKEIALRYAKAKKQLDNAEKTLKQFEKLKRGSIANVTQLTTISKMRIKDPVTPKAALYGVKVSERDMEAIENALIGLYITLGNKKIHG